MTIDFLQFTPWSALAGGALIGLSAVILVLFNGQVAGISGIVGNMLFGCKDRSHWRIAFVAGLLLSPWVYRFFWAFPAMSFSSNWFVLILAGVLVGFGTRLGSGCTSGHGVCGLSRLSLRSLVATLIFMGAGFVTTFVFRHLLGA